VVVEARALSVYEAIFGTGFGTSTVDGSKLLVRLTPGSSAA